MNTMGLSAPAVVLGLMPVSEASVTPMEVRYSWGYLHITYMLTMDMEEFAVLLKVTSYRCQRQAPMEEFAVVEG